jgi:hypothetical protein
MGSRFPNIPLRPQWVPFNGGADVVSPPLSIPPGMVREDQNFEQDINGGYTRVMGYERFDGRAKPSDAAYAVLAVTLTGAVAVGNVLTDNATTSFGTVIAIAADSTYVALALITGHFSAGNVKVAGVVVGTAAAAEVTDGASTALLHAQYKNLAANQTRALIGAVPGSGAILGVWYYNDTVYAFRANAGATGVDMYQSSAGGWVKVVFGEEVAFTNANTSVGDGDTLTQGGVTATVARVVLETGTLLSGVNTGRLIITGRAGGNFAAGAATSTGGGLLTLSGAQSLITLSVMGGRFEFFTHNFSGAAGSKRMYGCDGKNRGFEFDGTTFIPINTGMSPDTPSHVHVHKKQLFFGFKGSAQHSAPASPYVWSVIVGAGEIAMGDDITGFQSEANALVIATRNNMALLYGSGVGDWNLVPFDQEQGAIAYTIQHIGLTLMMDDRGLSSMEAAQQYGNFASSTISKRLQTWLLARRSLATAAIIVRDKNQYRLFFSDGSALYVTLDNGNVVGMLRQLLTDPVQVACSGEKSDGTEQAFFGSTGGFIFQMERGTSFDGANIEYFLTTVFNNAGAPRYEKSWRKATFEIAGGGYFQFSFSYQLGYASTLIGQPGTSDVVSSLSASQWDTFIWDQFYWDGLNLLPAEVDLDGDAENISLRIYGNFDYMSSARLSGALLQYISRKPMR